MPQQIDLQDFFIIHSRPYRNTSLLLDVFSREQGRFSCIAKGARQIKSKQRGLLQPFIPLAGQFMGRSELQNLYQTEMSGDLYRLANTALYSGFYLNELLTYLLPKHDPHMELFDCYQQTLAMLNDNTALEKALRLFELMLLKELGYGIQFLEDSDSNTIDDTQHYYFEPNYGFKITNNAHMDAMTFSGQHLSQIAQQQWNEPGILKSIKIINRIALHQLLDGRALKSRELFMSLKSVVA